MAVHCPACKGFAVSQGSGQFAGRWHCHSQGCMVKFWPETGKWAARDDLVIEKGTLWGEKRLVEAARGDVLKEREGRT